MQKVILGVLKVEMILTPVVFAWALFEYCECKQTERELKESFRRTKEAMNNMKNIW